jgi:16S rRNA (cytidine1402-2'-O)-methyltransferase
MPTQATLYVVATPIGNLSDLTARARQVLTDVPWVAAEDTRRTRNLLTHLGLSKKLLRCDEAQESRAMDQVVRLLVGGESVAFATDAGTPALSDPGSRLVEHVHGAGFPVVPIPGPSALTAILSVAGFRIRSVTFFGFLPKKQGERQRALDAMAVSNEASVFFEAPHRLSRTLSELAQRMPERMACIGRELTKLHEEILRGPLSELAVTFERRAPKGEFTVMIAPLSKKEIRSRRKSQRSTMESE